MAALVVGDADGRAVAAHAEAAHPEIMRRATAILEASRAPDGRIVLEVSARYTFGVS